MKQNNLLEFKSKLSDYVLGCFSKTTDTSIIEAMGFAGMDFVILDMEHGPSNLEQVKNNIIAAENSSLLPIVRVSGFESEDISKVLDLGAAGIQVPAIQNAEQAHQVLQNAKFHPDGNRGVCRFVRAAEHGVRERSEYFKDSNKGLVILQIEGTSGIHNFDDIISIEGIDIVFIGPYDLSQSLGIPGQIEDMKVVNAIEGIVRKAENHGVVTGTFCDTPEQLAHWRNLGIKYLAYSVDYNIFIEGIHNIRKVIK